MKGLCADLVGRFAEINDILRHSDMSDERLNDKYCNQIIREQDQIVALVMRSEIKTPAELAMVVQILSNYEPIMSDDSEQDGILFRRFLAMMMKYEPVVKALQECACLSS